MIELFLKSSWLEKERSAKKCKRIQQVANVIMREFGGVFMGVEMFKQTLGTEEESVIKKLEKWASEIGDKTFIFYGEEHQSITFKVIQ